MYVYEYASRNIKAFLSFWIRYIIYVKDVLYIRRVDWLLQRQVSSDRIVPW